MSGGAENPEILRRAPSSPVCAEPCEPAARFSQTAQCAVRVRCRWPIRGRAATPCGKSGAAGVRRRCGCTGRPGRSVALLSFYTPAWTGQPQRSARAVLRAADVVQRMRAAASSPKRRSPARSWPPVGAQDSVASWMSAVRRSYVTISNLNCLICNK